MVQHCKSVVLRVKTAPHLKIPRGTSIYFLYVVDIMHSHSYYWSSLQVVLTSSLEDESFGLPGIAYFNTFIQVCPLSGQCVYFISISYPRSISWRQWSSLVSFFPWGTNQPRESCSQHWRHRAHILLYSRRTKWKYKLTSIVLAVLTLYMLVCSIVCAFAVASQGDGATMLFSLLVTYGGECIMHLHIR